MIVKLVCIILQWDTCQHTLPKLIKCIPPGVNPNENYGLWAKMMCPCKFINYSKYTTLLGIVDSMGGYTCMGLVVLGKTPSFLINFSVMQLL